MGTFGKSELFFKHSVFPPKAEVPRCTWEKEKGTTKLLQEADQHPPPTSGKDMSTVASGSSGEHNSPGHTVHSLSQPLSYHYNLHRKKIWTF